LSRSGRGVVMCELVLNVSRVVAELVRCEDVGKMCFRGAQLVGCK
jgi:hypothetical protein